MSIFSGDGKGVPMNENDRHHNFTERIKGHIRALGADLVGIADVEPLKALRLDPPDLLDPFTRAISVAIRIPFSVFHQITDRPTPLYKSVYQTANAILDVIAYRTAIALEEEGHYTLPIPASQVLDQEDWFAAISHKAVARMAGLGWQGKNLLIITPEYGSRVRLVTVLTKAPLVIDGPIKNRCGDCRACQEACPAQAIKGVSTEAHYDSRNTALHFSRCVEKTVGEFAKIPEVGAPICGICIKACPFGKKL
jgi:epoxyqueuosine reductase QueG